MTVNGTHCPTLPQTPTPLPGTPPPGAPQQYRPRGSHTSAPAMMMPHALAPRTAIGAPQPCKWKEWTTKEGKKYYSDGLKSVWTEPPELTAYKA